MYLPLLRGRQYELIALRELLSNNLLSDNIIPIIEPVKLSTTLIKTLTAFVENNKKVGIIINPIVGQFDDDLNDNSNLELIKNYYSIINNEALIFHFYYLNSAFNKIIYNDINKYGLIFVNSDSIKFYESINDKKIIKYNLLPDENIFRRSIKYDRIIMKDHFNKKDRNIDYIGDIDEPFSDDHLFYIEDGYSGFSDYSIIGKDYIESGFAPNAVAIHIIYFDNDNSLRVIHFVSDSNEDISDPANKFREALEKLIKWSSGKHINTFAMSEFEKLYKTGSYPGLGSVKKLSIMHHLELVGKYLGKADL